MDWTRLLAIGLFLGLFAVPHVGAQTTIINVQHDETLETPGTLPGAFLVSLEVVTTNEGSPACLCTETVVELSHDLDEPWIEEASLDPSEYRVSWTDQTQQSEGEQRHVQPVELEIQVGEEAAEAGSFAVSVEGEGYSNGPQEEEVQPAEFSLELPEPVNGSEGIEPANTSGQADEAPGPGVAGALLAVTVALLAVRGRDS